MSRQKIKSEMSEFSSITSQIKDTILGDLETDPVAKQYVPSSLENIIDLKENSDPIGDYTHSPVKGIVHRHSDRALLKITDICEAYCRFCFRKDMVGKGDGILNENELNNAIEYIKNHAEIHEIILTGGDPLTLSNRRLQALLDQFENIKHIQIIRFHTRAPLMKPARIDNEFLNIINNSSKVIYIVLHVNHAQEINDAVKDCFKKLSKTSAVLLSQSVLLKNINDNVIALSDLFRTLILNRIKPYYLHHPDLAKGTGHFRVSVKKGQKLMKQLRNNLSGICLPTYVLDIPGGFGKIPIESPYIESLDQKSYILQDYKNQEHIYIDYKQDDD